jgi:hypothetical protein
VPTQSYVDRSAIHPIQILGDLNLPSISKLKIRFNGPGITIPGIMPFPKIAVFFGLSCTSPHPADSGVDCGMPSALARFVIADDYCHAFRELKRLLSKRAKRVGTNPPDPH